MRSRRGEPPKNLPRGFPVWNRPCKRFSWQRGTPCKSKAIRGTDLCKRHGGGGINRIQGWKRYLLWVMLPETIRTTAVGSPVTDEEVQIACTVLAQAMLTGDAHASAQARMRAVEYLFESQMLAVHDDPAILLTHLSREDARDAINILRRNNLIH